MRFFEMNNIFVYIEMEGGKVADVSLELLTKGRELATTLGVKLEAVVLGHNLAGIEKELAKYGADTVWVADDPLFSPFRTLPHTAVLCGLIGQEKPQIALFGATPVGRDFAPRVSSALHSGLTADCTQLEIGDHKDAKTGTEYKNLLYQIRPAFGGNIIATIVNPDHRPQMATVREGVMRKEYAAQPGAGEVKAIDWKKMVTDADLAVKIIDRQIEERKIDIKGAGIIVAGGYGMGSKENFRLVRGRGRGRGGGGGARRAPPSMRASRSMRVRWARRASRCVRSSTSPAASRVRSSTRPAWTSRRWSSRSTRTPKPRSTRSPTTPSRAMSMRLSPR